MDIISRLQEAKPVTALFSKFDDRGADAYEGVAPILFDSLDASDGSWLAAVNAALSALRSLAEDSRGRWLNPAEGAQVEAKIADLSAKFAKRSAALVDPTALAAKAFAELSAFTAPAGQHDALAAGLGARRTALLFPFNLAEHLPAIAQFALHSERADELASVLREDNSVSIAPLYPSPKDSITLSDAGKQANAYIRATYGPWRAGVSSRYENVVSYWAYLLVALHNIASVKQELTGARTKEARELKRSAENVRKVADLLKALAPTTAAA